MKTIPLIIIALLLIYSAMAVPFRPGGDIIMDGTKGMFNATNITAADFWINGTQPAGKAYVDASVAACFGNITIEAATRSAADAQLNASILAKANQTDLDNLNTALSTSISTERTLRQGNDSTISSSITAEANLRSGNDTSVIGRVDGVNSTLQAEILQRQGNGTAHNQRMDALNTSIQTKAADQRVTDLNTTLSARIGNVNTTANIQALSFYTKAETNATIDAKISTTVYLPTRNATIYGTNAGGNNIGNLSFIDGHYANYSEANGANSLEVRLNFTNVTMNVTAVQIYAWYYGTHQISVELWDPNAGVWESYYQINPSMNFIGYTIPVFDGGSHVSGGVVQLRFVHVGTGIAGHWLAIDEAQLQKGPTLLGSGIVSDSSKLSRSGVLNMTGDLTFDPGKGIDAGFVLNAPWIISTPYQSSAAGWTNTSTSTSTAKTVQLDDGAGASGIALIEFEGNRTQVGYNGGNALIRASSGKGVTIETNGQNLRYRVDNLGTHDFYGSNQVRFFGENNRSANKAFNLELYSIADQDDGTGATRRIALNFVTNNVSTDINDRALAIEVHANGTTQPRHVSFYTALVNGSADGKTFQWAWGPDTDGILQIISLNRVEFPETYTGFYQNQTNNGAGINSKDPSFTIYLDANNDSSGETFTVAKNTYPSTTLFNISSSGDVTVTGKLLVVNTTNFTNGNVYLNGNTLYGDTSTPFLRLSNSGGSDLAYSTTFFRAASGNLRFIISNTETARLTSTGLGIKTITPNQALEVNGSANVTSILYTPQICLNGDCKTAWPTGTGAEADPLWSGNASSYVTISSTSAWDKNAADDLSLAQVDANMGNWSKDKPNYLTTSDAASTYLNIGDLASSESDLKHDTCAEISGCVVGAITDGNTNWDNSYGFLTSVSYQSTAGGWSNTTAGTVSVSDVNVTGKLTVLGVTNLTGGNTFIGANTIYGDNTNPKIVLSNTNGADLAYGTSLFRAGSANVRMLVSGTEMSRMTATGFGIKTTSPGYTLDVNGTANIVGILSATNATVNLVNLTNVSSTTGRMYLPGGGYITGNSTCVNTYAPNGNLVGSDCS